MKGCKPKDVIWEISEDLLSKYSNIQLIDKYDIYQHLMNYWSEVMQMIFIKSQVKVGRASQIRLIIDQKDKGKKVKETPDILLVVVKKLKNSKLN